MTIFGLPIVEAALTLAMLLVLFGFFCTLLRLILGPRLPDRVVALDLIAYLAIGFIGLYTIWSDEAAFLDVAIALALVVFLATVAFARFAEQQHRSRQGEQSRTQASADRGGGEG
jgi:multicomponent Na+:H+ antiporter subunit F